MNQFKDLTVLMSACNSSSMPGVYRSFKNNGEREIRVIGVDMCEDPSVKYIVDAFYKDNKPTKNIKLLGLNNNDVYSMV